MFKELQWKVALVTGGTRGIGRATAIALAEAGADVLFTYRTSREKAEELEQELRNKGVRSRGYQADGSSDDAIRKVVAEAKEEFGPIAILVNNAGITRDKSFLKMTKDMWDDVLRVNLDSLLVVTQVVLPFMIESGWGRVINVSSVIGQMGNFGQANYAAAKGAAIAFTKALAREVAKKGVTVNAVAPGFIETDMLRDIPAAALDQVKSQTPVGRLGRPQEIADAITFLASPRSAFITGQVLAVNGGMYM